MKRKLIIAVAILSAAVISFGVNITELESYIASKKGLLKKRKKQMFRRMRKFNLPPRVKKAFSDVRRELFAFHRTSKRLSYRNIKAVYNETPLAIGYGQTISSPNMVAIMTKMCIPNATDKVLEIGTGSGYQGAVISKLSREVYSIEIVKPLGLSTRKVYNRYGYTKIKTKIADGYYGWKEHAPYDKILVTCATNHVPPPLIRQLKRGGIMLIPVGHPYKTQQLIEIRKLQNGRIKTRRLMHVRFVPMTGRAMRGR